MREPRVVSVRDMRPLNEHEIHVLTIALEDLAVSDSKLRDFAQNILDQKMPENMLWARQ